MINLKERIKIVKEGRTTGGDYTGTRLRATSAINRARDRNLTLKIAKDSKSKPKRGFEGIDSLATAKKAEKDAPQLKGFAKNVRSDKNLARKLRKDRKGQDKRFYNILNRAEKRSKDK